MERKYKNKYVVITGLLNETLNVIKVLFLLGLYCQIWWKKDILTQALAYSNIEQKISFIFELFIRSLRFAAFNVWPFARRKALHAGENLSMNVCVCKCKLNIAMEEKEKILWRHLSWKHVRLPLNCQQTYKGWMSCPVTNVVVVVVFCLHHHRIRTNYMRLKGLQFCVNGHRNVAPLFSLFLIRISSHEHQYTIMRHRLNYLLHIKSIDSNMHIKNNRNK